MRSLVWLGLMLVPGVAFAQSDESRYIERIRITEDGKTIRELIEKETEVDLDGAVIVGRERKPTGIFASTHGRSEFEKIIPERLHFQDKLIDSLDD